MTLKKPEDILDDDHVIGYVRYDSQVPSWFSGNKEGIRCYATEEECRSVAADDYAEDCNIIGDTPDYEPLAYTGKELKELIECGAFVFNRKEK